MDIVTKLWAISNCYANITNIPICTNSNNKIFILEIYNNAFGYQDK